MALGTARHKTVNYRIVQRPRIERKAEIVAARLEHEHARRQL